MSYILGIELYNDSGTQNQKNYTNLQLNNTISFDLNSTYNCKEVYVNFTSINETKDFITNGDLNSSSSSWTALNETDISYEWKQNGPEGANSISINLTGRNSTKIIRPMRNNSGIEKFENLDGWFFTKNLTVNFTQELEPLISHSYPGLDGTYSLRHKCNATTGNTAMGNSSYQFFYNSSFEILSTNLNFSYKVSNPDLFDNDNELTTGVYLIKPSNKPILLWQSNIYLPSAAAPQYETHNLNNLTKYLNETGFYNLTFYSIHKHLDNYDSIIYFDYIELNITWSVKEINNGSMTTWNQSISFNRGIFLDGILNFSYYITEKFEHINKSDVFLSTWINDQLIQASPLTTIINNTWVQDSVIINKSIIGTGIIKVSLGLLFNDIVYIFSNETFSLFFDNISFVIGSNPHPLEVDLKVFDFGINKSFSVNRDIYNNDFVNITNNSFTWGPSQTHNLNVTCNSSEVIVSLTLTYIVLKITTNGNGGNGQLPGIKSSDIITILIILVLFMSISSSLFIVRFQKRLFLNPKYDYIKKLRVKKTSKFKIERLEHIEPKKRCSSCGKYINAAAKFCEHCGQSQ
jgi:hypothetical protein